MEDKKILFMKEAIKLATENIKSGNGGPFGCVIVKDDKIIGRGVNSVTSKNDPTAHAEIMAIRDACKNLNTFQLDDCEIFTSCEPCPMCLGAIYWARPKRIFYGNTKKDAADIHFDDSFIYDEISLPINKRKIPTAQMLEKEAIETFTIWRNMNDKIEY